MRKLIAVLLVQLLLSACYKAEDLFPYASSDGDAEIDREADADSADTPDADLEADPETDFDTDEDLPCPPLEPPAPLTPENGAYTGSFRALAVDTLRPTFRWTFPPSSGCAVETTYDIEIDDSCEIADFLGCAFESPEASAEEVDRMRWQPHSDLPVAEIPPVGRRYFWRVRACRDGLCSEWSQPRYVEVGRVLRDVNGDGYDDVIVGTQPLIDDARRHGRAFVFHGGVGGVSTIPAVTLDNPRDQEWGLFGASVGMAGDVNGDGYADVIVGDTNHDNGAENEGHAFLYLGSGDGISELPDITLENPTNQPWGSFGNSVASAGDVNADGYADVIVGARGQSNKAEDEGSAFLYLGGEEGTSENPDITLDNPRNCEFGWFGVSVSSAGDINRDGYADVIIGAGNQEFAYIRRGAAYVFLGRKNGLVTEADHILINPVEEPFGYFGGSVASAGDINGDGFADVIIGAHTQNNGAENEGNALLYLGGESGFSELPDITLDNPENQAWGYFGSSVSSAGDINGDGYADVIVGAQTQSNGAQYEGNAFLYLGGEGGISELPDITLDNPTNQEGGTFGSCVASAGDVNGDRIADIIIGAPDQENGAYREGNAFLYLGGAGGVSTRPDIVLENPDNLENGQFGRCVAFVGKHCCGGMTESLAVTLIVRGMLWDTTWTREILLSRTGS